MAIDKHKISYNRGLRSVEPNTAFKCDVTLTKVTHIDLDSAVAGVTNGFCFMTYNETGFIYVKDLIELADAYDKENLFVVGVNW